MSELKRSVALFGSSRRQFLTGIAAMGAATLVSQRGFSAQTGGHKPPRRVDVHNHPGMPVTGARNAGPTDYFTGASLQWTVMKALDEMDQGGVDLTILSNPGGGHRDGDTVEQTRSRTRSYNDYMAKLVSDHPDRFGMWACLTLPDVDGALKETEYGLDTLKAAGVSMSTSYAGKYLGDPIFDPLFAELNRRKAVLYTHPVTNACCTNLVKAIRDPSIELPTDTTRAIMSMVATGASSRYPDVRIIFSHAGGTMPFLLPRLIKDSKAIPTGFRAEASRFYYDTAQAANAAPMSALKAARTDVAHRLWDGLSLHRFGGDGPGVEGQRRLQCRGVEDDRQRQHSETAAAVCYLVIGSQSPIHRGWALRIP